MRSARSSEEIPVLDVLGASWECWGPWQRLANLQTSPWMIGPHTYSMTIKKLAETGEMAYQHQALKIFQEAKRYYDLHYHGREEVFTQQWVPGWPADSYCRCYSPQDVRSGCKHRALVKDKVRRPNQQPRKTSEKMADQSSTMVDLTGGDEVKEMDSPLTLDDWDQWINPRSDADPIVLRNYSLRFSLLFTISNKGMWIIHSTAEVVSL